MSLRLMTAAAIAALALGAVNLQAGTASSPGAGVVAAVYDGDTLTLRDGRRIRLVQIDTPELGSGECYSRAARTALLNLAPPGGRVVLEVDVALDRVDRYGRLLRYIRSERVLVLPRCELTLDRPGLTSGTAASGRLVSPARRRPPRRAAFVRG